jgi:hypothetical protein
LEAEQERRKQADSAAEDRQRIEIAVTIVKDANEKHGEECFLIIGDIGNTKLSPGFYKWQCKYCRIPHHLCPKRKNLTASLDAHLLGDNHKKNVDAVKEAEGKRKALSSGRVGRPSWQASVVNALNKGEDGKIQQHIRAIFTSGSSSVGSSNTPKGTVNAALVCWGLWQKFVYVDGCETDVKPFLLDQKQGANWSCEPYLEVEIDFEGQLIVIDGCFRHRACQRFDVSLEGYADFTCKLCACIPQEPDFRGRIRREHEAEEKRGRRDTGQGRRLDYLR